MSLTNPPPDPPNTDSIDKILAKYYGDDTLAGKNSINLKAKAAIQSEIQKQVVAELEALIEEGETITHNADIYERIAELKKGWIKQKWSRP